jgi:hypothetical protein
MTREQYAQAMDRAHQHEDFRQGLQAAGLCLADRMVAASFDFKLTLARWPGTDVWACIAPASDP